MLALCTAVTYHKAFLLQWVHGLEFDISFFPPDANFAFVSWTHLAHYNPPVFYFYLCRLILSILLILSLYRDYYTISTTALNYYAINITYSDEFSQEEGAQWFVCSKYASCCTLQKHKGWKVHLALSEHSKVL